MNNIRQNLLITYVPTYRKEGCLVATNDIAGNNFSLQNGIINFYGAKGMKDGPKNWAINVEMGGDLMIEVEPDDLLPSIQECIDTDVKNGDGDKIAMLVVRPRTAVSLFLKDVILPQHLREATEIDDIVDLPKVPVLGRLLTVRVDPNTEFSIATADATGAII